MTEGRKNRFRTLAPEGAVKTFEANGDELRDYARSVANRTGSWVGIEEWSPDHPQDEMNQGWALIETIHPDGYAPPVEPGPRCLPLELPVGEVVDVWGFGDAKDWLAGRSKFHKGRLRSVERSPIEGTLLDLVVKFDNGSVAYCVEYAVAHIIEEN